MKQNKPAEPRQNFDSQDHEKNYCFKLLKFEVICFISDNETVLLAGKHEESFLYANVTYYVFDASHTHSTMEQTDVNIYN